jgi:hypothetical protein
MVIFAQEAAFGAKLVAAAKDGKVSTTQEELVVIFLDNHHRWKNRVFCTSPPHTQLHEMPTPPPNTFH